MALPTQRLVAGAATFSEVGKLATRTDGLEPLTELEQADADAYLALIQHALRTAWVRTGARVSHGHENPPDTSVPLPPPPAVPQRPVYSATHSGMIRTITAMLRAKS